MHSNIFQDFLQNHLKRSQHGKKKDGAVTIKKTPPVVATSPNHPAFQLDLNFFSEEKKSRWSINYKTHSTFNDQ